MLATVEQKSASFVALHQLSGGFAIPNPWDIGSARLFERIGFEALATTSSGFAQTLGRADGMVTLDEKLQHCEQLAAATNIPITADLENGFGDDPESVAECVWRAAETGIVGASIEDFTRDSNRPIYDFNLSVERIAAAVEAARSCAFPFTLTARAEQLLRADYDLDETIRRLQAYESAGADVLYAPALRALDDVRQVADSVGKPLNVLGSFFPGHTVQELGEAGATRISIGGAMANLAEHTTTMAARSLLEHGDMDWAHYTSSDIVDLFATPPER